MDADGEQNERKIDGVSHDRRAPEMLIVFRAGELRLGIDVRHVREVARAIPLSAPLPNAGGMIGMIVLRGESIAVVDLNVVLGVPCEHRDRRSRMIAVHHNGTAICLLVDQIDGLHEVTDTDLTPPPPALLDVDIPWLDHVTRSTEGELIGVVHVGRMLSQVSHTNMEVKTTGV